MEGRMRVSVVATGIDAAIKRDDMPLPRRSMASPLKMQQVAEDVPAPRQAAPAPRQAAPVAARVAPAAAPVMQERAPAPAPQSRTLFEDMDDEMHVEEIEDDFADIHEALCAVG